MTYTQNSAKLATTIAYRTKTLFTNMDDMAQFLRQSKHVILNIHNTVQAIVKHSHAHELRLNEFKS